MKFFLGVISALACVLAPMPACAQWLLTQASERVVGGEPVEINVIVLNDGREPMTVAMPRRLPVKLRSSSAEVDGELVAVEPLLQTDGALAPGAFHRQRYRIVLPVETENTISIELSDQPTARMALIVERPISVAAAPEVPPAASVAAPSKPGLRPTDTIAQPALQTYEPMYFVVGRRDDTTSARFQLSFKYRLFDEKSWLAERIPVAAQLYFGYTQNALWDLSEASSPFRDTSYRPSLFYLEPDAWSSADGSQTVAFAAGLEHESNARSGDESRALNIAYIQPSWRKFLGSHWYVSVAPKLWLYLDKDENNSDIEQYRGYGNLNLRLGRVDGWLFSMDVRKGTQHFGSLQLDASYPIRQPFFANAGGYLHFQYFNGYGESLLDYNVKGPAQYRIGFSIVR